MPAPSSGDLGVLEGVQGGQGEASEREVTTAPAAAGASRTSQGEQGERESSAALPNEEKRLAVQERLHTESSFSADAIEREVGVTLSHVPQQLLAFTMGNGRLALLLPSKSISGNAVAGALLTFCRHKFTALPLYGQCAFWFDDLGLPSHYFEQAPVATIAMHVESFQAARVLAKASGHAFEINLKSEAETEAMFMCRSLVGKSKVRPLKLQPLRRTV